MLKITLFAILYGYTTHAVTIRCPTGSGQTADNPCLIGARDLVNVDERIIIDIDESIKFATINCMNKGCEKKVSAFLGAQHTRVICPTADSCLASSFYCARGPPGSDQDLYDGDVNNGVECILEANGGVSSVAKETNFIVFENGNGIVRALGDVAFGVGNYRCYSNNCVLECGPGSCSDTDITEGDKTVTCVGDCNSFKAGRAPLFPPIIATPDANGDCVISDTGRTDSKTKIVFKNNCKTAKLDCSTSSTNCEKRRVFCAAQDSCDIDCGGRDLTKPNEVSFLSGKCKEMTVFLGPILFDIPFGTSETDFDVIKKCHSVTTGTGINAVTSEVCNIEAIKSNINLIGSDAMGKGKINAVLTDVTINANGAKTFGEGSVVCGFNNKKPANRNIGLETCTLICTDDTINGKACEKCKYLEKGGTFVDAGMQCRNALGANRVGMFKQQSVASVGDNSEMNSVVNNGDNIVIPVHSFIGFAILFATLTFIVTMGFCGYKKFVHNSVKDGKLLKYGTMNELQTIETKA